MKTVNQKYQPMIIEKWYLKSGNRNSIAMNKNELQTLKNLPFAAIKGHSGSTIPFFEF
jgi:hypothetical protein